MACFSEWTNCRNYWGSLVSSLLKNFFSGNQCCDKFRHYLNIFVSSIFHVTVNFIFQGSYCTFRNCRLNLNHCKVSLCSFSFAKFCKTILQFPFFCRHKASWVHFFRNLSQKLYILLYSLYCKNSLLLYIFWKGPGFLPLWFYFFDSEPELVVCQQRQLK